MGIVTSLHGVGILGDGLAWQDDRLAFTVSTFYNGDHFFAFRSDLCHFGWYVTSLNPVNLNGLGKKLTYLCVISPFHNADDLQGSLGGGVIQTTASESTFVCLLAGRSQFLLLLNFCRWILSVINTMFSFNCASFRTEAIKRFQVSGEGSQYIHQRIIEFSISFSLRFFET